MPRGIAGTGVAREVSITALKARYGYKEPTVEQKKLFEQVGETAQKFAAQVLNWTAPGELQAQILDELDIITAMAQVAIVKSNGV